MRSSRFLVGALLGSFVAALALVAAAAIAFPSDAPLFPFMVFLVPFMLSAFLVLGWPLFLLTRGRSPWLSGAVGVSIGALVGVLATLLLGGPDLGPTTLVFAVDGALGALVCWLFTVSPNKRFQPTFLRCAQKRG